MRNKLKRSGFTLIEILIGTSILGLLGLGVLGLQYVLAQNQTVVLTSYLAIDEANSSVSTIAREIRGARTGENGAYAIAAAGDNEIIFYTDYDFDGEVDRIRYTLSGNTLEKGVIKPQGQPATYPPNSERVQTLSRNVRNLSIPMFTYYSGSWPGEGAENPLTLPANLSEIKTVGIYVRLNTRGDDPTKDFELKTFTSVRMLKENL
jgi:prepilin-type N-terminal cleavage/methylation domain-containing protein